jgi:predicted transcriptional regulator
MPSVSKKQHNLMALVANNPKAAKRLGISQSVGKEFMSADKGKKFKGGGMATKCATKSDAKMIAKKEVKGHESSMHKMKKGGITEKGTGEKYKSKAAMMKHEKKESKAEEMKEHGMCGGGMAKKYARGGGIEKKGKTKGKII